MVRFHTPVLGYNYAHGLLSDLPYIVTGIASIAKIRKNSDDSATHGTINIGADR